MSWVLVTGGALGLGAEICRSLAGAGYSLIIHYNTSKDKAENLKAACEKKGVGVYLVQGDFSSLSSTEEFIGRVKKLNLPVAYLINNVGNYLIESALNTPTDDWYALFQVNLHAPFSIIKGFSETIISQKGGIINLGVAGLASGHADTYSAAYTTTKLALLGLTKSLAKELASSEVTVNMISPGYLTSSIDLPIDRNKLPTKKPIEFSEVVSMILLLLGDSGRNITGQNIEIAGGVRL